jgi:DNA modification methylase
MSMEVTGLPRPDWQTADGRVQLFNQDCMEVLPWLPCVDVCITDPPYEIDAKGGGIATNRQYLHDTEGFTDCGFDYSILTPFGNWVCFGTLKQVPKLIENAAGRRHMLVTWNKPNPTPLCNGNYLPDTEYIVHAWEAGQLFGDYEDKSRFFVLPATQGKDHPNEKPLALMEKLVRSASRQNQTVVDPFMGSGTTGVACVREGRRFIGCEVVPKHFRKACRRIEAELSRSVLFEPPPIIQRSLIED